MNLKIISSEFFNAITSEHLSSTLRDSLELVLDSSIVKEGVLRDIPFFNTIYNIYQSGVAMQQHLFIKKIEIFLRELSNVSSEERLKFVEWMDQNPKQKGEFGETLLLLIDRADSLEKPSILARLLRHHILGNISYDNAMRLSSIVDRVYIAILNHLQTNPASLIVIKLVLIQVFLQKNHTYIA